MNDGRLIMLHAHIVFATRRRHPWITAEVEEDLWRIIGGAVRDSGCWPRVVGGYRDHVHILVSLDASTRVSDLVRRIKGASSHWVRRNFESTREFRWQGSYAAFSVSPRGLPRVERYIANQREIHERRLALRAAGR